MSEKNKGQFQPGKSGNPGGRPKGYGEVRDLAREHTQKAIDVLAGIMYDDKAPASARQAAGLLMVGSDEAACREAESILA
jgi:hypothetical protein